MEELYILICGGIISGILLLVFIVTTLTRLRTQDDLIGELRKDLKSVRNEIRGEKDERVKALSELDSAIAKPSSEIPNHFEKAKEAAKEATQSDLTPPEATPPPLPVRETETAENAGIKLTADPAPVFQRADESTPETLETVPEPRSTPAPARPEPAGPGPLQLFLEKIYLWPPSGDTAAEATIGAWWATRIGLIVGIIAAVFGGIYVADGATPWMRVLAMTGVSVGVTILGLWLEKRVMAFGRLISTGGLGLGYFTAFAAFALEPMRVITSPEIGLLVQSAMIAVMVGWSLWKRDELVASMAILLGYVTCWFSLQNDEMNFVVTGLLLLAIAASFLIWRKGWLWSQGIAIVGTWLGFLVLGVLEWSNESAPPFVMLISCLVGALVIFEAGHFFAARHFATQQDAPQDSPEEKGSVDDSTGLSQKKWLKRISVLASSLSIFAGYITVAATYPDLKEWFFLTFAVVMLVFSLVHYFRKNELSRGLDQMFFIKASGLLCLFFVAKFDGPVRWLSIAAQAGTVLWAWKRTGYRWVEAAFGILFFVAIGTQIHGVLDTDFSITPWHFFSAQNVVGLVTLVALSFWLTLHRHWKFSDLEEPVPFDSPWNPVYMIAAGLIAIAASVLALTPWQESDVFGPVFLIVTGLAIASPLLRWPKAGPFIAATVAMWAGFAFLLIFAREMDGPRTLPIVLASAGLAVLITALCRRGWQEHWHAGNFFRLIYSSFGFVLLVRAMEMVSEKYDNIAPLALFVIAAAGVGLLLLNAQTIRKLHVSDSPQTHRACQWTLSVLIGIGTVLFTMDEVGSGSPDFQCVWLAIAGAILLSATFFLRNFIPAAAGGIPLVFSMFFYFTEFSRTIKSGDHLMGTASMITIFLTILLVLWHFTKGKKSDFLTGVEVVLGAAITLFIHWGMRPFFEASEILAADSAIALGLLLISRKWPMRALKAISGFSIGYAIVHVIAHWAGIYEAGPRAWWWIAAAFTTGWAWLFDQGETIQAPRFSATAPDQKITFGWTVMLATAVYWIVSFFATDSPWSPVVFAGFAILVLALWRFCDVAGGHVWTWILLASAGVATAVTIIRPPDGQDEQALAAVFITAGLIVFHGTLFPRSVKVFRDLSVFHAVPALALTFWACLPGVLGVDKVTTVCWGVASIVLFVAGLIAGLKTYRIVGLVGLGLCIARMFIFDIDDTLYRIIAFFAVAVVLLIIGFLYNRFRGRIENQFSGKSS